MRGTPACPRLLDLLTGIIPAYAGNTNETKTRLFEPRDHPRVCGEHPQLTGGDVQKAGSSPRMRGTHVCKLVFSTCKGIIPAYAGNTPVKIGWHVGYGDHPRVCGEHLPLVSSSAASAGSSPRMRGTPHPGQTRPRRHGIIPAYAGNTSHRPSETRSTWDHPRVCGEHWIDRSGTPQYLGSSPRMRGTQSHCRPCMRHIGIIPAYAGNTSAAWCCSRPPGDHPRVCGEHTLNRIDGQTDVGIIPAYAGNTISSAWRISPDRDHPRVCGEHHQPIRLQGIELGSSPRMRGTLDAAERVVRFRGIIPAYAGNT